MDPVTIAAISAAASATKSTIDALSAILSRIKGRDAEKAAPEAQLLIADLNTRLLALQEIAFRLHQEKAEALEENAKLRAEIRQKEEGAADREHYELRKVGSSVVVVHKSDPNTYLCATCYEAGRKVYLTKLSRSFRGMGTHLCPQCRGVVGAR